MALTKEDYKQAAIGLSEICQKLLSAFHQHDIAYTKVPEHERLALQRHKAIKELLDNGLEAEIAEITLKLKEG